MRRRFDTHRYRRSPEFFLHTLERRMLLSGGPTAVASPGFVTITAAGTTSVNLAVTYTDSVPIDLSTIASDNLATDGLNAQLLSVSSQDDGDVAVAQYQLTAPHGAFFWQDTTLYHISLNPGAGAVLDSAGNAAVSGTDSPFIAVISSAVYPYSSTYPFADTTSSTFTPEASAQQSNGKTLVVGHVGDTTAGQSQLEIERLNADGSLDTTFGNNGIVLGPTGDNAAGFAVKVLPNDEFLIAGVSQKMFMLERYTANGVLDTSFGPSGTGQVTTAIADVTSLEMADTIAIASDGSIILGGTSDGAWAFADYSSAGLLNSDFLYDLPSGNDSIVAGLALSGGSIVAAGPDGANVSVGEFSLSGSLVSSFNGGEIESLSGLATRQNLGYLDHNVGLNIDSGGDVLVAATTNTSPALFATERLLPSGLPDASFGNSGIVTTSFSGNADAQNISFTTGDDILVSGVNVDSSGTHSVSVTYTPAGAIYTGVTPPPALSISGEVYNGVSGAAQSGVTVFIDANHNGILDTGEVGATTNAAGQYTFSGLAPGSYTIDEVVPSGFVAQTAEAAVALSSTNAAGPNFLNTPDVSTGNDNGPDLVGQIVSSLPASVVGASKGEIALQISNQGKAAAEGTIQVALYASTQTTPTAGLAPFATLPVRVQLQPGHSRTFRLKFVYPSDLAAGAYHLIADLNSTDSIAESNIANNLAVTGSTIATAPPAVTLTGSLSAPTSLPAKKRGTAQLTLTNTGNTTASGTLAVTLYASTDGQIDGNSNEIGTATLHIRLSAGRSGRYRISLVGRTGLSGSETIIARVVSTHIAQISGGALVIQAPSPTTFS